MNKTGKYLVSLVKDTIKQSDLNKLAAWIKSNPRLTKGKLTEEFERAWSKWNGNKYSVFVNSGSSANLLMVYALVVSGRLKNMKAIVPAVSWVTTVTPFIQFGFQPILCDCDSKNFNLDIDHFEKLCKEHHPSVAILVHVLGHPGYMEKIQKICKKNKMILLEDCCESHGTEYKGKKVGTFGRAASFSFYFGHHMSTIEGGMVVTDDRDLYNVMLSIRSHGWSRDLEDNYHLSLKKKYHIDDFRDKYTFYYPGFNLRSTDLNAFLGIEQLKRLDKVVIRRQQIYQRYLDKLKPYFQIQESNGNPVSSFAFGLITDNLAEVIKSLEDHLIECRPLVCGSMGEQPFWIERYGKCILPNATRIHNMGLYVPGNQDMTNQEVDEVCKVLVSTITTKV